MTKKIFNQLVFEFFKRNFQKAVVKPIQVNRSRIGYGAAASWHASMRNINAELHPQYEPCEGGYEHVHQFPLPGPDGSQLHVQRRPQPDPLENIDSDKGVKLPPVTQMVTHNGKVSIVHKWPSSLTPHRLRDIKNKNQIKAEKIRKKSSEQSFQKRVDDKTYVQVRESR